MDDRTEKDIFKLDSIIQYCDRIGSYIERFGDSVEDFRDDYAYRDACSLCVAQVGELTGDLSDELKKKNPDIEWNRIKGLRNIIDHNYGSVKTDLMWIVLTERIPELRTKCLSILDDLEKKF